jgi:hypothetical protein
MDEYTVDAFVNRDEPIPVIAVAPNAENSMTSAGAKGGKLKRALSPTRLKTKPMDMSASQQGVEEPPATPSMRNSIQDRLFST